MVDPVMVERLRSLACVLGLVVALVGVATADAAAATPHDRGGETSLSAPSVPRVARAANERPTIRVFKRLPLIDARVAITLVLLMVLGMIGQLRRLVRDVGDRWRSLLRGAPPAAA